MTPGSTVAVKLSVSISNMRLRRVVRSKMPPRSGTHPPHSPVPEPRTVTGMTCAEAKAMMREVAELVAAVGVGQGVGGQPVAGADDGGEPPDLDGSERTEVHGAQHLAANRRTAGARLRTDAQRVRGGLRQRWASGGRC